MTVQIRDYELREIEIIQEKLGQLSIQYEKNTEEIRILDKIDQQTFQYLINFSQV